MAQDEEIPSSLRTGPIMLVGDAERQQKESLRGRPWERSRLQLLQTLYNVADALIFTILIKACQTSLYTLQIECQTPLYVYTTMFVKYQ